jgi:hypothetical protein
MAIRKSHPISKRGYCVVFWVEHHQSGIVPSHRSIIFRILLRLREAKDNADPELVITLIGNKADKACRFGRAT